MPTITNVKLTDLPVLSSARGLSAVDYFDVSYYDTSLSAYFSCKMPPSEIVKYLNKTYGLSGLSDVSFTALSSGDVLKYDGTKFVNLPDEGVGIHNLHDPVHNVQVSTLANNDVLAYDSSALKWKNKNFTSTPHNLNSGTHTDILAGSPTYGQAPVWNGSKFEFMNVGGQYGMDFDTIIIKGTVASTTNNYVSSIDVYDSTIGDLGKIFCSTKSGLISNWSDILPINIGANISKTEIFIYDTYNAESSNGFEDHAVGSFLIDWNLKTVKGYLIHNSGLNYINTDTNYFDGIVGTTIVGVPINGNGVTSCLIETTSNSIVRLPRYFFDRNLAFTIKNYKTVALSPEVETVYIKGWFDGASTSLSSLTTIIDSTRPAWCSLSASQKFSTDLNGMFPLTISNNVTKTEIECFATGDSERHDNIDDEEAGKLNVTIDWNNSSVNGVYNFMDRIGQDFSCGGILSGTTTSPIFVGINNKGEADSGHDGANENYSASVPELQIIGRTITKLPKIKHTSNLSYTIRNYKTSSTDLAQVGTKYDTGWMIGWDKTWTTNSTSKAGCKFTWLTETDYAYGTNFVGQTYFYNPTLALITESYRRPGFDLDLTTIAGFPTTEVDAVIIIKFRYNGDNIYTRSYESTLLTGMVVELSNGCITGDANYSTGTQIYFKNGKYYMRLCSDYSNYSLTVGESRIPDTYGSSLAVLANDGYGLNAWLRGDFRIIMKTI